MLLNRSKVVRNLAIAVTVVFVVVYLLLLTRNPNFYLGYGILAVIGLGLYLGWKQISRQRKAK